MRTYIITLFWLSISLVVAAQSQGHQAVALQQLNMKENFFRQQLKMEIPYTVDDAKALAIKEPEKIRVDKWVTIGTDGWQCNNFVKVTYDDSSRVFSYDFFDCDTLASFRLEYCYHNSGFLLYTKDIQYGGGRNQINSYEVWKYDVYNNIAERTYHYTNSNEKYVLGEVTRYNHEYKNGSLHPFRTIAETSYDSVKFRFDFKFDIEIEQEKIVQITVEDSVDAGGAAKPRFRAINSKEMSVNDFIQNNFYKLEDLPFYIESIVRQRWVSDNQWQDRNRMTTVNTPDSVQRKIDTLENGAWKLKHDIKYEYDEYGNTVRYKKEFVDNVLDERDYEDKTVWTYSSDGKPIVCEMSVYNYEKSIFEKTYRKVYDDFSFTTSVQLNNRKNFTASIFPNPSTGSGVQLALQDENSSIFFIEVYDLLGRLQATYMQKGAGSVFLNPLPTGNYIVSISNGTQRTTLPLVIQ